MMSQKPRPAARQADPASVARAEPTESIAESIPSSAETPVDAVAAEAASDTITTATGTVTAVNVEVAPATVAIETTEPTTVPTEKKVMNNMEEFVAFSQGNLEAFMKSGEIWSAGIRLLTNEIAATAKISLDDSVSTFKSLSTAKSLKDVIELQTRFTKTTIEHTLAGTKQITVSSIKLTEETLAPITERAGLAVEALKKLTERTLAPATDLVKVTVGAVGKAA